MRPSSDTNLLPGEDVWPDETIYVSQPLSKHTPLSTIGSFGSPKNIALIDGSLAGNAKS